MTASDRLLLVDRRQLLQAVFADGLEHPEAWHSVQALVLAEQALAQQRRNPVQHVLVRRASPGDALRRFHRKAAHEHREATEEGLLVRGEEIEGPGDGVAHRPLASRGVAGAAAQERKTALQPGQQGRRSEEGDAGGGQLDGEWQALQPGADLRHGRGVRQAQGEVGPRPLGHARRRVAPPHSRRDPRSSGPTSGPAAPAGGRQRRVRWRGATPRGWWRGSSGPEQRPGGRRGAGPPRPPARRCRAATGRRVGAGRRTGPRQGTEPLRMRPPAAGPTPARSSGGRGRGRRSGPGRRRRPRPRTPRQDRRRRAGPAASCRRRPAPSGDEADLVAAQQCGDVGGLALAADQRRPRPRQVRRCELPRRCRLADVARCRAAGGKQRRARSAWPRPRASASRRTVSRRGARRAPRSRSLTPRGLRPARAASSSWERAAVIRWRRSSAPNADVPSVAMPGPASCAVAAAAPPGPRRVPDPSTRPSAMVRIPPPCRLRGRCVGAARGGRRRRGG